MMNLTILNPLLPKPIAFTFISLFVILAWTRLLGLRSFSKMTGFDFVCSLAVGSLFATGASAKDWETFIRAIGALSSVFFFQFMLSKLRSRFPSFKKIIANPPAILFADGEFDQQSMTKYRVTEDDLIGKLREANAIDLKSVRYIVLEATGDISVLHGDSETSVSKKIITL